MLCKLNVFFIILILLLSSCKNKSDEEHLVDLALDFNFHINAYICEFTRSERYSIENYNINMNSCYESAEYKINKIISNAVNKKTFILSGNSFVDSIVLSNIEDYLGKNYITSASISVKFKYWNREMFTDFSVIEHKNLNKDWNPDNSCLIEVTDLYYSSDEKKAALGLLNYCGHPSKVYQLFYFINVKGTWLLNFIEVGI